MFRAEDDGVSEAEEVVPCGFWKSFLTSKCTLEDVGSTGAGEEVAVGTEAVVEPAVNGVEVEVMDKEVPEANTEDLDDIDALPLT